MLYSYMVHTYHLTSHSCERLRLSAFFALGDYCFRSGRRAAPPIAHARRLSFVQSNASDWHSVLCATLSVHRGVFLYSPPRYRRHAFLVQFGQPASTIPSLSL